MKQYRYLHKSRSKGQLSALPKFAPGALLEHLPVCINRGKGCGVFIVVGEDSGVVVEPKKVIGAVDPPLLFLCELWEPGQKQPVSGASG